MKKTAVVLSSIFLAMTLVACGDNEPKQQSSAQVSTQDAPKSAATDTPKPDESAGDVKETAPKADEKPENESNATKDDKSQDDTKTETNKATETLAADAGQKRYEATCKLCHDQGLLNAPKKGDKAEWAKRLEKGKDTLYTHSIKGFNKMPAQATADVSEAEVRAAVDYLLEKSM